MTPATTARLALVAAALPIVLGLVAVRPADAQAAAGYESYSLTALAAGVRTAGDVGAAGGLASLDTGSASVTARLDSAPSAAVLAAPYEPGALFRTVVGQVNAGAGEPVLDVPDAEAQFPGSQTEGSLETVPPAEGGPVSSRGGAASALATATSAAGTATGQSLVVAGALEVGASTSSVELTADAAAGTTTSTARTVVSRVLVGGVLELRDVVATASVVAKGDSHVPTARLTIGGVTVAGQGVVLSDEGVTAAGTTVVPGGTIEDATEQANAALTAAGIQISTVGTTQTSTARDATADSGGVSISLVTPTLPGGVAGNRLDVVVGGVVLTATDTPVLPGTPVLPAPDLPPVDTQVGSVPSTTTTFVPGLPGTPGIPGTPGEPAAPAVAAPQVAPASVVVAGRSIPAVVALAAFAVWQFLTLGTATLYGFVERRRRLALEDSLG